MPKHKKKSIPDFKETRSFTNHQGDIYSSMDSKIRIIRIHLLEDRPTLTIFFEDFHDGSNLIKKISLANCNVEGDNVPISQSQKPHGITTLNDPLHCGLHTHDDVDLFENTHHLHFVFKQDITPEMLRCTLAPIEKLIADDKKVRALMDKPLIAKGFTMDDIINHYQYRLMHDGRDAFAGSYRNFDDDFDYELCTLPTGDHVYGQAALDNGLFTQALGVKNKIDPDRPLFTHMLFGIAALGLIFMVYHYFSRNNRPLTKPYRPSHDTSDPASVNAQPTTTTTHTNRSSRS
jgi:hypothetical protein